MKLKYPLSIKQLCFNGALGLVLGLMGYHFLKAKTDHWMEEKRLQTASTYKFPTAELAELDRLLQARFAIVPTNSFGMFRVGGHEIFKPVTASEQRIIEKLRHQNQEVVFYVAGRNYLTKWPSGGDHEAFLQGPVYMTQKPPLRVVAPQTIRWKIKNYEELNQPVFQTTKRPADLPSEAQLNASLGAMLISNSGLDHTATSDGQTYQAGNWQVAAVPVRATNQECVGCHSYVSGRSRPRLGDPLGIALYAFRSTARRETKIKSIPLSEIPHPN